MHFLRVTDLQKPMSQKVIIANIYVMFTPSALPNWNHAPMFARFNGHFQKCHNIIVPNQ